MSSSAQTLPACSAATLAYIESETADVIAQLEVHLGTTLGEEGRSLIVSICILQETSNAARELREAVKYGAANCWN
jgi:hypothetical protein